MLSRRSLAVAAAAAALGAGVLLGACGDDGSHHPGGGSAPVTTTAEMKRLGVNGADVTFAQMMIPHHEQAIEMSELALDPKAGAGAAVTSLARAIQKAQDPEIVTMRGWLSAWGAAMVPDPAQHDMSAMQGMMSAQEMRTLGALNGTAFDRMWLEMMIRHHEGAIVMANDVRKGGSFAPVKILAEQVIAGQQAEITQMRALLQGT